MFCTQRAAKFVRFISVFEMTETAVHGQRENAGTNVIESRAKNYGRFKFLTRVQGT